MNHTMFYLMSWVREKLEKKQINNETHSTGEGKKEKKKKKKKNLVWGSSANRSGGPFEVDCFSAVNSLRTCVISECKASLDFFLPENAKYLITAAQCLTAVLERLLFKQPRKNKRKENPYLRLVLRWKQSMTERLFCKYSLVLKKCRALFFFQY